MEGAFQEEDISINNSIALSYDATATYEEQVAALPVDETPRSAQLSGLAARISANRVYLPPENAKGKRKREENTGEPDMDEDEEMIGGDEDLRPNALYLQGLPIAHLPTNNIFAYARHFDMEPVGMEWIDDESCVLIFPTNASCHSAFEAFRKSDTEEPDADGCVTAKPVPVVLWPAEDRINKTLGASEGLAGPLVIRIARRGDKKVRGAKQRSEFYRKHGMTSGGGPGTENGARKRKREGEDDDEQRRRLDDELDSFLRDKNEEASPSVEPPSKLRSEQILAEQEKARNSRLERTLLERVYPDDNDQGRRRRRTGRTGGRRERETDDRMRTEVLDSTSRNGRNGGRREKRPMKTAQELDDELQAFLEGKN